MVWRSCGGLSGVAIGMSFQGRIWEGNETGVCHVCTITLFALFPLLGEHLWEDIMYIMMFYDWV